MTQPKQARQTSRGRIYVWPPQPPHEFEVDSVTKLLGGGIPKPGLTYWSAKSVAEFAYDNRKSWYGLPREAAVDLLKRAPWRQRDAKADIGTLAHAVIEAYVAGEPLPDMDKAFKGYALAGLSFLEDRHVDVWRSEVTVYSRKHQYAGTLDILGVVPEFGTCVVDFKTGKEPYPEVALQLAAYAHADFIGLPDGVSVPLPQIEYGLVVILRPDGSYAAHPVEIGEEAFQTFLHAKGVYEGMQRAKGWIGQPLEQREEAA